MNKHLQPLSVPTFQVTREACKESKLPEWLGLSSLHFFFDHEPPGHDWEVRKPRHIQCHYSGNYGDYLAKLPVFGVRVLTPEQHDALLGEGGTSGLDFDDEEHMLAIIGQAWRAAEISKMPFFGEAYEPGQIVRSIIEQVEAHRATKPASIPITDEMIEEFGKIFADASEYYVPFHRGLSSPSADKLRAGVKAVLEAAFSTLTPDDRLLGEQVAALIGELLDGPSKGRFYGIGPVLRTKLETIRLTALSSPHAKKGPKTP